MQGWATLGLPLGVQLRQLLHHVDRGRHRLVGVVVGSDRRSPLRHDRVADELVERAAVPEHAVDHLREVLRQQRRHVVRRHGLGQRREAADVGKENNHAALLAAQPRGFLRRRDALGELRREIALKVAAHHGLSSKPLGLLAVVDGDGRDARERDHELEVFLVESMRRRHVIHVEHAEHALGTFVSADERHADGRADLLHQDGLAAEALVFTRVVRLNRDPVHDRRAGD